jgi:hypothetical protein
MNASQKFDDRLSSKGTHVAILVDSLNPDLAGVTTMATRGPQMKKVLAFLFLLALALTGGMATVNTLISPPAAHDRNC